jgi:uncharacterized repeat protein (TIGR01451 family)
MASISAATPDPDTSNNTDKLTTPVTVVADVAVSLAGPASATAGLNVVYTATATNLGPSDAQDFTFTDSVPAGAGFVSESQVSGPALTCTNPAVGGLGTTTCTRATVAAGATVTLTLTYSLPPSFGGSAVADTAQAGASTTDPAHANNSFTATTPVASSADLAAMLSGPSSATAGDTASYTATVTNNGPSDAKSVTVSDAVPAGTTFTSESQGIGPTFGCSSPPAGTVGTTTCTIAALAAGAAATFTFTYRLNLTTVTPVTDTVDVSAATSDPASGNNHASATTAVLVPTTLVAYPALVELPPAHTPTHVLSATLTTIAGVPLVGEPITFSAGGQVVCVTTTDATGTAICSDHAAVVEATRHHQGFDATFAGDPPYQPSSAHGVDVGLV